MDIADGAAAVDDKDCRRADQEELLGLEVLPCHLGTFIGQDGVGWMEFIDVFLDHAGSVGDHHEDLGVEGLELGVVMTQLRHMVHAVRSGKADVEYQQRMFIADHLGQGDQFAGMVRQGKIRGWVANG